MRKFQRAYVEPMIVNGVDECTLIVDDKPCICKFEGELAYIINNVKVKILNFTRSGSVYIKKFLKQVKSSTCKNDKLVIKPIEEALKARVEKNNQ